MIKANYHCHTTYCDGKNTAEEMVLSAIEKGFTILGFSGHGYMDFDSSYCMSKDGVNQYRAEISRLAEKYKDKITIYLGIEHDMYSGESVEGFQYVLASAHYILLEGNYLCVDYSLEVSKDHINRYFAGDPYSYAEEYFKTVSQVVEKGHGDIIGHFDLVAKFNENNELFDENHPRYKKAVKQAVEILLKTGKPFEINTGAIYRGLRTVPYPSRYALELICKGGGDIVVCSDSHDTASLGCYYEQSLDLMREVGFTHHVLWTSEGIKKIKL